MTNQRRTHDGLQETVDSVTLSSGAAVTVVPSAGSRCHVQLSVGFGALHESGPERGEPDGIAHFLEHRLFEKEAGDISERFSDLGADVDAQTGFSSTAFSVSCSPATCTEAVGLLFELVGDACFPSASVVRERSIVGHEIQLFEDNLDWASFQSLVGVMYPQQRLAVDIAGTPESLASVDAELLRRCHQARYGRPNLHMFAAGPLTVDQLLPVCDTALDQWTAIDTSVPVLQRATGQAGRLHRPWDLPRPRLLLGWPDNEPRQGLALMRHELALELTLDILFGPCSEFFSRHYESGLLDGESFGGEVHQDDGYGFCLIGGDTEAPDALRDAVLQELARAPGSSWIEQDFERARRRACGDMICRWEDVESVTGFLESAVLRGCHPFDAADLYAGQGAVNVSDIHQCLRDCLHPERLVHICFGPVEP